MIGKIVEESIRFKNLTEPTRECVMDRRKRGRRSKLFMVFFCALPGPWLVVVFYDYLPFQVGWLGGGGGGCLIVSQDSGHFIQLQPSRVGPC